MNNVWLQVVLATAVCTAMVACSDEEEDSNPWDAGSAGNGGETTGGTGGGGTGGTGGENIGGTGGENTGGIGGENTGGTGGENTGGTSSGGLTVDHNSVAAFDSIPANFIETAKSQYRILYGHTSHGSQITSGIDMLETEVGAPYDYSGSMTYNEISGDLGHNGDLSWEQTTRAHLDGPSQDYNMVMWSWCGGCSDNTSAGVQAYLDAMNQLEIDYPNVTFVYMTGHTDGSGESGTLQTSNNQIREYCRNNGKILYDFGDIEMWDPDANYYPDTSDDCGWCSDWCDSHSCPDCNKCAHSHCFNCYLKGKGFWWMMARLVGWNG